MVFGQWLVVGTEGVPVKLKTRTRYLWMCKCSCGTERAIANTRLTCGESKSCGCGQSEGSGNARRTHGMISTRAYCSWLKMIQRCTNPNDDAFHNYGGRGITVCQRWRESFENFYADMGERPKGLTIERVDTNGNYEPSNCRWATRKEQLRNRRNNVMLTIDGETKCIAEWAEQFGMAQHVLYGRIKIGWSVTDAITRPVRSWHPKSSSP